MPPRDGTLRIRDIIDAVERIMRYTASMDYATFAVDERTVDAVIRNFIIIGEASRHVPEQIVAAHPQIPWRDMADMRNVVVHAYHQIDLQIVWHTINNDLPGLIDPLTRLLGGVADD